MRGRRTGIVAMLAAALLTLFGVAIDDQGPGWRETAATQDVRYQAVARTSGDWGAPRQLGETLELVRTRLANHRGESYSIAELGTSEWSVRRNLPNTVDRLHDLLAGGPVGEGYFVKAWADGFQEKTRKVDINPAAYANTDGTQAVDIIVGTLRKWYPSVEARGIYVCRTIAGSSSLSQHAYANAVDVFGTIQHMDQAAYGILKMTRAGYVPASQILWNYENLLTGGYVYDHTTHIHFSGDPLMSGGCRRP